MDGPISPVQKQKLLELYRQLAGCDEKEADTGIKSMFMDTFKHPLEKGTYVEAAHLTAELLKQQRQQTATEQRKPQPSPQEAAPEGFQLPTKVEFPREMSEAPFSWNTYAIAQDGFEEQWTVRSADSKDFIGKVQGLKKYLNEHQYQPSTRRGKVQEPAQVAGEAPVCAIHKTPLEKRNGKNGTFWSCPKRLDDGSYCPYKPK